jgi:hypothetical protein
MKEGEHSVDVWGKKQTVEVYQKSKSVWIAVGSYKGRTIEVKGSSESAAIGTWAKAARSQGNW